MNMFIRDDLLNEIKKIFEIKEFNYMKVTKNSNGTNLLLFNAEKRLIAIESKKENKYYMYEVAGEPGYGGYCVIVAPVVTLFVDQKETWLTVGLTIVNLPGKAFDFDKEFIIAALENP